MIGYRKTRQGDWAVCGPATEVRVGAVTVTKRDGTTKTETVTRLGSVFETPEGPMVYGYLAAKAPSGNGGRRYGGRNTDNAPGGRSCPECGQRDCSKAWSRGNLCDED
jgi:hypothetical protein